MTATELLDRPTNQRVPVLPDGSQSVVYTGLLLDAAVVVEADRPLPVEATRLLDQLNQAWDVRRRHSDLDRVNAYPTVMISVSPPTRFLLDNTLAAIYLARLAGLDVGACHAILDHRHGRIGADPDVAAMMARLVPATAADLLADICHAAGIRAGSIRVGAAVHHLGEPVEAWLAQVTDDITHALDEMRETPESERTRATPA